jgi:diacylglycerol kinase (ATP)
MHNAYVPYSSITIIYNPNSTGNSPTLAQKLAADIKARLQDVDLQLIETEYAGHAEELAYQTALASKSPLIISVSGDGGYNEVINGAMKATDAHDTHPICAILPAGNANDHHKSVAERPLIEAIVDKGLAQLDLLQVSFKGHERYAHSYVGLGLTPFIARELNKHKLSVFKETWLAVKTYWRFHPFTISHQGQTRQFDSILMANISRMAKHLTLTQDNDLQDGKFELLQWPHRNKLMLAAPIIRAMLGKPIPSQKASTFTFTSHSPLPIQLDGELLEIPPATEVTVRCLPKKLRTIL